VITFDDAEALLVDGGRIEPAEAKQEGEILRLTVEGGT
jgi:hypothetical protein